MVASYHIYKKQVLRRVDVSYYCTRARCSFGFAYDVALITDIFRLLELN
jgi:hypothetical protein